MPNERRRHERLRLDGRMAGRATVLAEFRVLSLSESGASIATMCPAPGNLSQDKPARVKVLGVNLAVFRDQEGKARVIWDTCTHRGASLAGAWQIPSSPRMVNGCVVCPYHGWEFNGAGECVNIPSLGYGKPVPPRAKVDAYPVQEKYGIVFAFLGDLPENERPPLMEFKEWGDPKWRANTVLILDVPYYYERSIEMASTRRTTSSCTRRTATRP